MRDYLFRGHNGKEWLYGYAIKENKMPIWYICSADKGQQVVQYKTIGQYIGYIDRNGNKVFEGDICSILFDVDSMYSEIPRKCTYYAIVNWDEDKLQYIASFIDSNGDVYEEMPLNEYLDINIGLDVEVVGNIYDNPIKN